MGGTGWRGRNEACCNFRTYFIAIATNTYTTMYYEFITSDSSSASKRRDAPGENPVGGAPPARVEQTDRAGFRLHEVDRDAVGDRNGEQNTGIGRHMPIESVEHEPTR